MKVLIAHARYIEAGGEEALVDTQTRVLEALGHEVVRYEQANTGQDVNAAAKARTAAASVWSPRAREAIAAVITRERPDVLHVHNNFQAMSPSIYAAARAAGVPVVQHVHNYRYVCINAFLERDGHACTDCVGKAVTWPGVAHRCYRSSLPDSVAATAVQLTHRARRTYHRDVDLFLAVSEAVAATLRDAGVVPASKLAVCHNGLDPDPGARVAASDLGYGLYVGRLSPEKGVETLLDAAAGAPALPLRIVGDGPFRAELENRARRRELGHVSFFGRLDRAAVLEHVRGARVIVVPSIGSDPLPTTIIEASASGVATIGSRTGGIPELIADGETGALVPPGDAAALATVLRDATTRPDHFRALGAAARGRFESHFTGAAFGHRLVAAYESLFL